MYSRHEKSSASLLGLLLLFTLFLFTASYISAADDNNNEQEGSLNTSNVESTVDSNNVSTDESTSNTYNGAGSSSEIPVGSAISPSYMSNGAETCLQGKGGSIQTGVLGFSKGGYKEDIACNRRRDSKVLNDLGMKVAAIARMCQDVEVWRSMFVSGTPCPVLSNGRLVVGKRAFLVMKTQPSVYIPDYIGETKEWYNTVLGIGKEQQEESTGNESNQQEQNNDVITVSAKFRSSLR